MVGNINGYIAMSDCIVDPDTSMNRYDALPEEYRKFLRDAPYNMELTALEFYPEEISELEEDIFRDMVKSVRETYGPSHPQAKL
jgi:hypothetical protein